MADHKNRPLILVTNDDGIASPGLRAAARAAMRLGEVLVVAPSGQQTGAGRSMPDLGPLFMEPRPLVVNGVPIRAYAVAGTPTLSVMYGVLAVADRPVSLVISGINYGENLGMEITASGTVGAALEAAAMGIPALAVSRETHKRFHFNPEEGMDFTAAEQFTELFGRMLLARKMPPDVDVLKVDVPDDASPETPWRATRVSRQRYYYPIPPEGRDLSELVYVDYEVRVDMETLELDSDIRAMAVDRVVSAAPISLDLSSRVDLSAVDQALHVR
jgi:5'-nucleotidase